MVKKEVKVLGEELVVRAEIATLQGVSGHADKNGLLRWMDGFETVPPQIFVNHGDHDQATAFVETLKDRYGVQVNCPWSGSEYDLASGKWIYEAEPVPFVKKKQTASAGQQAQQDAYNTLLQAIQQLESAAKGCRQLANGELRRLTESVQRITKDIRN